MKRNLRIILLLSIYSAKTSLSNWFGALLFTFGKLIRFGMFLGLILLLVNETGAIKGYNTNQALVFFLTFNLVDTVTQFLFREVYRFRPLLVSGDFDTILVKPYHPFVRILFGGMDLMDLGMLLFYVPLTAFVISRSGEISSAGLTTYLILIFNAFLIAAAFHILVLALAVLTTQVDHAIMIYRDVFTIGRFPIDIYRDPFRSIFTFIIPVGVMVSFPAQALFSLLQPGLIIFSFVVCAVLLIFSLALWNRALKKYQSWGG